MKLFAFAALACVAMASDRTEMFAKITLPSDWSIAGFAGDSGAQEARFLMALTQRNLDKLEAMFWDVSNPESSEYTNYKNASEILDLIQPSAEVRETVISWLQNSGVSQIKDFGDSLEIFTTVEVASTLFAVPFYKLAHADGREIFRSMDGYSLPAHIAEVVDFVSGVCSFPIDHKPVKQAKLQGGEAVTVPQTLQSLYNIPAGTKVTASGIMQTVVEFQSGQSYMPSDLQNFAGDVGITIPAVTAAHQKGAWDPSQPGDECSLDIEYISALGAGAVSWWWQDNFWVYDWATTFFGFSGDLPQVASVSYGWAEDDQCQFGQCSKLGVDSAQYVQRTNTEFQKIGLRGVSVMIASGDSGANGRSDPYCSGTQLKPTFPGASPYVTAVGATEVRNPTFNLQNPPNACKSFTCVSGGDEAAVSFSQSHFASGGGFSNVASRPAYQDAAVMQFFKNTTAYPATASYFNNKGRGYPDVAALGSSIYIWYGGQQTLVGGTSASTPEWSGIISQLNGARALKGKKPLGFLNQALYKAPANAFNDITQGNNKCTEEGCGLFGSCKGFDAIPGWDPVSGLGSPNYVNLEAYFSSLP